MNKELSFFLKELSFFYKVEIKVIHYR